VCLKTFVSGEVCIMCTCRSFLATAISKNSFFSVISSKLQTAQSSGCFLNCNSYCSSG
jgi:hypothetical protein